MFPCCNYRIHSPERTLRVQKPTDPAGLAFAHETGSHVHCVIQNHRLLVRCNFVSCLRLCQIFLIARNLSNPFLSQFTVPSFCFTTTSITKNCSNFYYFFSLQPSLCLNRFLCKSSCSNFKPALVPTASTCPFSMPVSKRPSGAAELNARRGGCAREDSYICSARCERSQRGEIRRIFTPPELKLTQGLRSRSQLLHRGCCRDVPAALGEEWTDRFL